MESFETYEEIRQSKINAKLRYQKWYDSFAMLFGFLGWIWEYSEYDRYFEQIKTWAIIKGELVITLLDEDEVTYLTILRTLVSLSTAALRTLIKKHSDLNFLVLCIYARYRTELDIILLKENFKSKMSESNQSWTAKDIMKAKLYTKMGLEMVYLSVHSLPSVNINYNIGQQKHYLDYSLDMLMFVIMQGRVYLIFRLVKHYSKWMGDAARSICYSQGTPASHSFAFKAILKERPGFLVTSCIALLMVLGGLSMRVFERPYEGISGLNWDNYINSFWVTFAIITTVGYGDIYPTTHMGRSIGVFTCIAGQFLVSLMVTAIASLTSFSGPQERSYNRIRDEVQREKLLMLAKNVVVYGFRHFKEIKKAQGKKPSNKYYTKYMKNLLAFKELKKFLEIEEINTPFEMLAYKVKGRIEEKKFELVRAMNTNKKILNKVITMENQMKASETILDYLYYQGTKIHEALENAARDSTVNRPFDGLIANARALQHFDILTQLDPPPQLKAIDYDLSLLSKPLIPHPVFTEQQKMQLYYRIERSINITNPELTKILKENKKLPQFALREKRILASNPEALNSLRNYIVIRAYSKNPRGHYLSGAQLVDAILAGKYLSLTAGLFDPNPDHEDDDKDAQVHETYILDENNMITTGESPSRRLTRALSILKEHQDNPEMASNTTIAEQIINKLVKPRRVQFKGVSKGSIPSIPEGLNSMKSLKEVSPKLVPAKSPYTGYSGTILIPNEEMDEIVEEEEASEANDFYDSMMENDKAEGRVPQWNYAFMTTEPTLTTTTDELRRLPDMQSIPVDQENIWYKSRTVAPKRAVARQKTVAPTKVDLPSQKTLGDGSQTSVTSLENKFDKVTVKPISQTGVTSIDKLDRLKAAVNNANNVRDSNNLQSGKYDTVSSRKMTGGMDGFSLDDPGSKVGSSNLENPPAVNLKQFFPRNGGGGGGAFGRVVKDAVNDHKYSGYDHILAGINTPAPAYPGSNTVAAKRGSYGVSEGKRGSGYSSTYAPDITTGKRGSYGMSEGYSRNDDSSLLEDDIIKEFKQALDRSHLHQHQKLGQQNNFGFDKKDPYKATTAMTPSMGSGRTYQDYLEDSNFGRTQQNDSWNTLVRDDVPLARQELDWRNKGLQTVQGAEERDARLNRDRGYTSNNDNNSSLHWFAHLDTPSPGDPSLYYAGKSSLRLGKGDLGQKPETNLFRGGEQKPVLDLETPGLRPYNSNPQGPTFWSGF